MRTLIFLAALLGASPAFATDFGDFAWMRGCWRQTTPTSVITEVWSAPPMGVLIGYSYEVRGNQLREWEALRIDSVGGALGYVASPNGHDPVRFALVEGDTHHVVFANAAHDFPKRIEYAREGDHLRATVSGGDEHAQSYAYDRITCPAELLP